VKNSLRRNSAVIRMLALKSGEKLSLEFKRGHWKAKKAKCYSAVDLWNQND
jgi:hypothetical protein